MTSEESEERDAGRTAELSLRDADSAFDAGPVERIRALDIYAEFSPWIDPTVPEGTGRLARILGDPRPLDPRLRPLVALASESSPDEGVRLGAMLAAVRWSLVADEYACADASVRRLMSVARARPGGVPPSAYEALCDVMTGQGRETEAMAAFRRLDDAVEERGGSEDRIWRANHRCIVLSQAHAWDDVVAAVAVCEALWRAGPAPKGYVLTNGLARVAARAHLGLQDLVAARQSLATIDEAVLHPTEAPRFRCDVRALRAEIELAAGNTDAALALAREVMHDGDASPGTWCGALTTALEVSDRTGRAAEVNEIVATLTDLLLRPGDRIGLGVSLRIFARAFNVLDRTPADEPVTTAARHAALDDLVLRIGELCALVRQGGGLSGCDAGDRRVLANFRRGHAAALAPLHRALAPVLTDAASAARRRIDEAVGDLTTWSTCESCMQISRGIEEPLPIGHLLGPAVRATLPVAAQCRACASV